jgi:hypothetical protein
MSNTNGDYMPRRDADFNTWQKPIYDFAQANLTTWITAAELGAWKRLIYTWDAAYAAVADGDAKHSQILAKNNARDALETSLRQTIKNVFNVHPEVVTPEIRVQLGLPIYKTTRTPTPVATTYPDSEVDSGTLRRLIIDFYDHGNKKSKAKPPGQHGAEIRWVISETPIVDVEDLAHSAFDTKTPFTLEFQGHQRGKTVYFCLRWENTRGEKGPWSEIKSAIIP